MQLVSPHILASVKTATAPGECQFTPRRNLPVLEEYFRLCLNCVRRLVGIDIGQHRIEMLANLFIAAA